ncbi:MAG: GIY-YIG nuclease family protein [Planctomycetes bacterium]|nr:GIY-YIG nuclease family protein [Planctomycetota bacterium]
MKSNQLVCQCLENISRKALENYGKIIKDFVRRRHGIYALYRKNKLYYVGLASNLASRLNHHLRDRHANTWDRFSVYLTVSDRSLRELETLAVRIASPKGNKQQGKFGRTENLKRKFPGL